LLSKCNTPRSIAKNKNRGAAAWTNIRLTEYVSQKVVFIEDFEGSSRRLQFSNPMP
jgi:hypothetical protein